MTMKSAEQRFHESGLTPPQREELILKLHRQGWRNKDIGARVGMSESGVLRAIQRLTKS